MLSFAAIYPPILPGAANSPEHSDWLAAPAPAKHHRRRRWAGRQGLLTADCRRHPLSHSWEPLRRCFSSAAHWLPSDLGRHLHDPRILADLKYESAPSNSARRSESRPRDATSSFLEQKDILGYDAEGKRWQARARKRQVASEGLGQRMHRSSAT